MRRRRRQRAGLFLLLSVLLALAFTGKVYGKAPSDESGAEKDWQQVYLEYIDEQKNVEDGGFVGSFRVLSSAANFARIYLDDDDVPELFMGESAEVDGERVITSVDGRAAEYRLFRCGTRYMEREGWLYTHTGNMDHYLLTITRLENGEFTVLAKGRQFLNEEDEKRVQIYGWRAYRLTCEWEGKEVSLEEFYGNIEKYIDVEQSIRPEKFLTYREMLKLLRGKHKKGQR